MKHCVGDGSRKLTNTFASVGALRQVAASASELTGLEGALVEVLAVAPPVPSLAPDAQESGVENFGSNMY